MKTPEKSVESDFPDSPFRHKKRIQLKKLDP